MLPRDTKIVFKYFGIMNCWYQGDTGNVTMCWEMIGSVLGTFRKHEAQVAQTGGGDQPGQGDGTTPQPSPPAPPVNFAPPAAGKEVTLVHFMQGRYTARIRSDTQNGPFSLDVEGIWDDAYARSALVQGRDLDGMPVCGLQPVAGAAHEQSARQRLERRIRGRFHGRNRRVQPRRHVRFHGCVNNQIGNMPIRFFARYSARQIGPNQMQVDVQMMN